MSPIDLLAVATYLVAIAAIAVHFRKRARADANAYFLAGRTLPWWVIGTSMVATTFAADTPLLITGWARDSGVWKNWAWWCLAVNTALQVFLFARWWRRGRVMTKAEFAELRYGERDGSVLRGFLGVFHAFFVNSPMVCSSAN